MSGCTDATAAPRTRNACNSSLLSAPLECNAILPFHSIMFANARDARAISASGTQNHINSPELPDKSVDPRAARTCLASFFALCNDAPRERAITSSMEYPARCSAKARAVPRFPAPTITTRGFVAMPGSIAEVIRTTDFRPRLSDLGAVFYIVAMPKSSRKPAAGKQAKVRILSSKTVYRGPVFTVTTDHVQEPGGVRARRDIIHHTGSVVVLAVDDSGKTPRILLERQYRHAAGSYLWELPAGRIDPGEQELKAAQRELLEETGYTATKWRRILKFYASPGFVAETMAVYLATGLRKGLAQPEEDEIIYKRLVPLSSAVRMVVTGTVKDAKTIASVLWLDHMSKNRGKK
jgi:ADP-ribose pyrophosphatase